MEETKWTAKVQALQQEHENEKHQLTLQIEKLKTSVTEELNTSSIFYKKRMEELGQKLQEQNDLIITQKHQIQKLATKSVESIRSPDVKNSAHNIVQPKASLSSMCARQRGAHIGGSLSTVLPKAKKRSSIAKRPTVPRTIAVENTSTPKTKKSASGDGIPRKPASITTPPFSSEEEVEDNDIMHSYISPELSQPKPSKSGSKINLSRFASQSDMNSPEEDEVEEIKVNIKPSKGAFTQRGTDQVEKNLSSQGKENKPAGGISVVPASFQKNAQGVKFTGVVDEDEDDWDLSSLEEENPLPAKDEKVKTEAAIEKNDANATTMVQAWGTAMGKATKEEGLQDPDTTSTLKSSLVTVTDWSDSSDI